MANVKSKKAQKNKKQEERQKAASKAKQNAKKTAKKVSSSVKKEEPKSNNATAPKPSNNKWVNKTVNASKTTNKSKPSVATNGAKKPSVSDTYKNLVKDKKEGKFSKGNGSPLLSIGNTRTIKDKKAEIKEATESSRQDPLGFMNVKKGILNDNLEAEATKNNVDKNDRFTGEKGVDGKPVTYRQKASNLYDSAISDSLKSQGYTQNQINEYKKSKQYVANKKANKNVDNIATSLRTASEEAKEKQEKKASIDRANARAEYSRQYETARLLPENVITDEERKLMTTWAMQGRLQQNMKAYNDNVDNTFLSRVGKMNVQDYVRSSGAMGALDQMTFGNSVSNDDLYKYSKTQKGIMEQQKRTKGYMAGQFVGAAAEFGTMGQGLMAESLAGTVGEAAMKSLVNAVRSGSKTATRQAIRNIVKEGGYEALTSIPLNALDTVKMMGGTDNVNAKDYAWEMLKQTGFDFAIGAGIGGVRHGANAAKLNRFDNIQKKIDAGEIVSDSEMDFYNTSFKALYGKVAEKDGSIANAVKDNNGISAEDVSTYSYYSEKAKKGNLTKQESQKFAQVKNKIETAYKKADEEATSTLTRAVYGETNDLKEIEKAYKFLASSGDETRAAQAKAIYDNARVENNNIIKSVAEASKGLSERLNIDITTGVKADLDKILADTGNAIPNGEYGGFVLRREDGSVKGIYVNSDSPDAMTFTIGHEITHALEESGQYDELAKMVRELDPALYKEELARCEEDYSGIKNAIHEHEAVGNLIGDILADESGEYLRRIAKQNRTMFEKIADFVKNLFERSDVESTKLKNIVNKIDEIIDEVGENNVLRDADVGEEVPTVDFAFGKDNRTSEIFYSKTRRAVEKLGKNAKVNETSFIRYLQKSKNGVSADEMKWLGIKTAFEENGGVMSKQQLLDWIDANRMVLETKKLAGKDARWNTYYGGKATYLEGGKNYEETLFKMPNSQFESYASVAHWGTEKGIVVHARTSEFNISNGIEIIDTSPAYNHGKLQEDYSKIINEIDDKKRSADAPLSAYDLEGEYQIGKNFQIYVEEDNGVLAIEGYSKADGHNPTSPDDGWEGEAFILTDVDTFEDDLRTFMFENVYDRIIEVNSYKKTSFEPLTNSKTLYVDEIQSDWHNYNNSIKSIMRDGVKTLDEAEAIVYLSEGGLYNRSTDKLIISAEDMSRFKKQGAHSYDLYILAAKKTLRHDGFVLDEAPYAKTYQEYAMKRMLRDAVDNDKDYIAWSTAKIQEERWSDEYAEGYRIEYDQQIPSFMEKYCKQWGGKVEKLTLAENGAEVWGVKITDKMRESVGKGEQADFSVIGRRSQFGKFAEGRIKQDRLAKDYYVQADKFKKIEAKFRAGEISDTEYNKLKSDFLKLKEAYKNEHDVVKQNTGWYFDHRDKNAKYEISDKRMKLRIGTKQLQNALKEMRLNKALSTEKIDELSSKSDIPSQTKKALMAFSPSGAKLTDFIDHPELINNYTGVNGKNGLNRIGDDVVVKFSELDSWGKTTQGGKLIELSYSLIDPNSHETFLTFSEGMDEIIKTESLIAKYAKSGDSEFEASESEHLSWLKKIYLGANNNGEAKKIYNGGVAVGSYDDALREYKEYVDGGENGINPLKKYRVPKEVVAHNIQSVLIHEIQHVIQRAEGFTEGGTKSNFTSKFVNPFTKSYVLETGSHSMAHEQKNQKRLDLLNTKIDNKWRELEKLAMSEFGISAGEADKLIESIKYYDALAYDYKARSYRKRLYSDSNETLEDVQRYKDDYLNNKDAGSVLGWIKDPDSSTPYKVSGDGRTEFLSDDYNYLKTLSKKLKNASPDFKNKVAEVIDYEADARAMSVDFDSDGAFTAYELLGGEIEARDTQARHWMLNDDIKLSRRLLRGGRRNFNKYSPKYADPITGELPRGSRRIGGTPQGSSAEFSVRTDKKRKKKASEFNPDIISEASITRNSDAISGYESQIASLKKDLRKASYSKNADKAEKAAEIRAEIKATQKKLDEELKIKAEIERNQSIAEPVGRKAKRKAQVEALTEDANAIKDEKAALAEQRKALEGEDFTQKTNLEADATLDKRNEILHGEEALQEKVDYREAEAKRVSELNKTKAEKDVINNGAKPKQKTTSGEAGGDVTAEVTPKREKKTEKKAEKIVYDAEKTAEELKNAKENYISDNELGLHAKKLGETWSSELEETERAFKAAAKSGEFGGKVKRAESYNEALNAAREAVNKDFGKVYDRVMNRDDYIVETSQSASEKQAVLEELLRRAGQGDEKAVLMHLKVIDKMDTGASLAGHMLQYQSYVLRNSPNGRLRYVIRSVDKINKEYNKALKGRKVELSAENAQKILNATDPLDVANVMDDVARDLWRQTPASAFESLNQFRHLAMLFNAKTHFRNIGGNTVFAVGRMASDTLEIALTKAASKTNIRGINGKSTMSSFVSAKELGECKDIIGKRFEVDYKTNEQKASKLNESRRTAGYFNEQVKGYASGVRNTFAKFINKNIDVNYNLLDLEDRKFFEPAYRREYVRYCKTHGITEKINGKDYVTAKALNNMSDIQKGAATDWAMSRAREATFRDDSAISKRLIKWKQASETKQGGLAKYGARAMNVAFESVLPFVKTPVNILRRGIDYSPLGLLRGVGEAIVEKDAEGFMKAIHHMSTGFTGTTVMALGMWAAQHDWVTVNAGDVSGDEWYDREMGYQDYSIKVLGKSYTLDWLSPMQFAFFEGAEVYNRIIEGEGNTMEDVMKALEASVEPMMEMSFMSSAKDTVTSFMDRAYRDGTTDEATTTEALARTLLGSLPQGWLGSFVPQLLSQTAGATDKYVRDTQSTNKDAWKQSWESFGLKMKNKIPGLRESLNVKCDRRGKATKSYGDNLIDKFAASFVTPWNVKNITIDDYDRELIKMYSDGVKDAEKNNTSLPKNVQFLFNNFTGNPYYDLANGKRMTYEEKGDYLKVKRKDQWQALKDMVDSKSYKYMTNKMKLSEMSNAHFLTTTKADLDVYGYKYVRDKLIAQDEDEYGNNTKELWRSAKAFGLNTKQFVDSQISMKELATRSHAGSSYYTKALAIESMEGVSREKKDLLAKTYGVYGDKMKATQKLVKKYGKEESRNMYANAYCSGAGYCISNGARDNKANMSVGLANVKEKVSEDVYRAMGYDWQSAQSGGGLKKYGYDFDKLKKMKNDALLKFDSDSNNSLKKAEVIAFVESLGIEDEDEKACVFQYFSTAKNPYGTIKDHLKWGKNEDESSGSGGGRGGWGSSGGGSGSGGGKKIATHDSKLNLKVTNPFGGSNTSSASNLNDAYRKKLQKLLKS